MNSPIRTLREALKPFTDNSPGGKYRTRPEDFDAAKAAYEATASADDGVDRSMNAECRNMLQVAQARLRDLVGRVVDHEASATIGAIEDVIDKIDAYSSHEPPTGLAAGIEWLKGEISDGDAYLRDYPDSAPELEQQAARKNLLTAIAGVSQAPPDADLVQMLDDLIEAAKHHAVHGASRANEKLLEAKRQNILNYDWCLRAASKEAETEGASPSPCVFPRADEDGSHGGWTLDQHMLTAIYKEIRTDEFAPSEEGIEAVLLAYEKLFGRPSQPPTAVPGVAGVDPWQVPLWDAINRYVRACRGDPSKHVYGNTPRQTAVSEVNDIVRSAAQPSSAEPVAYRRFLVPQYDYSDRYRYRDATSIGAPEGWEPLYATPRTSRVDAEDAARWRALIGCARVRVLGSAGIYRRNANGSMHIGIEFWTHHETPSDPSAIEDLINFATLAAMGPTKSTERV